MKRPTDRADIVVRVFHMKIDELTVLLKEGVPFGKRDAMLYAVEFQKRGLPHVHILLSLNGNTSQRNVKMIDSFISPAIPDPVKDPLGL